MRLEVVTVTKFSRILLSGHLHQFVRIKQHISDGLLSPPPCRVMAAAVVSEMLVDFNQLMQLSAQENVSEFWKLYPPRHGIAFPIQ
jgi:hypothetical protein